MVKRSWAFWVSAAAAVAVIAFSGGILSTLLSELWPEDGLTPANVLWVLLFPVVGLALILAAPVIVAVSSPGSDALGIATRSGSMLALLFTLFIVGHFLPYWRGWFDLEDEDWREIFRGALVLATFIGFAVGFLGGLVVSAGRYIVRVNRKP